MKILKDFGLILFFLIACNTAPRERINPICFENEIYSKTELVDFEDVLTIMDRKIVEASGYFHLNFEDVALYPSKSSAHKDAIWLNFIDPVAQHAEFKKFDGRLVTITGIVNSRKKGHFSEYLAEIDSVFCIRLK